MNDTGHPNGGNDGGPAQDSGSGSVHIGSMSGGSIATGSHGHATSVNHTASGAAPPYEELLRAIRVLREALPVQERSAEDRFLDGELADAEGEIVRSGTARPERLARLLVGVRGWLGSQTAAVGAVASATAVVQGIAQLLG
ncbi:hypothetical protein [Streptomyces ortus]|uniref:Uncharacterized protein n=1 Tax=Streptomyces ortus TaxID=2867268 RepID=A0ABT3VEE6_9ACTN|nr:hypothetical protein [Streptomyces ortus]MCX4238211.1 hypothetical protein [Streptomyces ortus]